MSLSINSIDSMYLKREDAGVKLDIIFIDSIEHDDPIDVIFIIGGLLYIDFLSIPLPHSECFRTTITQGKRVLPYTGEIHARAINSNAKSPGQHTDYWMYCSVGVVMKFGRNSDNYDNCNRMSYP